MPATYPFCIPIKENDDRIVFHDPTSSKKDFSNVKAATAVVLLEMVTQRQNHGKYDLCVYCYILKI